MLQVIVSGWIILFSKEDVIISEFNSYSKDQLNIGGIDDGL